MSSDSFFDQVQLPPPDGIFGLSAAFQADPNPQKVDLMVGTYKDDLGRSPCFQSIQQAQLAILEKKLPANYLPFTGDKKMLEQVSQLVYGEEDSPHLLRCQALGGTGALFLSMALLKQFASASTIAFPSPTWPNHPNIALQAGLSPIYYNYYDLKTASFNPQTFFSSLDALPPKTIVLLHACCHNPTGIDPSPKEWEEIANLFEKKSLFPLFDAAYQGFGKGLDEDMFAPRLFKKRQIPHLVCYSMSKNFSLYSERVGALFGLPPKNVTASDLETCIGSIIRRSYSNPPRLGAASVAHLLSSESLKSLWIQELSAARERITQLRVKLVRALTEKSRLPRFEKLLLHHGFFSYSGLSPKEVQFLKEKYGIYMISDGRISLPGLSTANFDYVTGAICDAISTL